MIFDVLISDCENLSRFADVDVNVIRIPNLTQNLAVSVAELLLSRGITVVLLPQEGV